MIPVLVTDVLLGAAPGACCEHEVLHQLMRLYLARRAAMDRLCNEQHISRAAAAALHEIVLAELLAAPLTPSALAAALGITNASVSAIVRSRLELVDEMPDCAAHAIEAPDAGHDHRRETSSSPHDDSRVPPPNSEVVMPASLCSTADVAAPPRCPLVSSALVA